MTRDFRHVGKLPTPEDTGTQTTPRITPPPATQRILSMTLYATATGFLLAGIWLLTGRPSPIPQDIAHFVGFAFVMAALFDVVAVQVMKRVWAKNVPH